MCRGYTKLIVDQLTANGYDVPDYLYDYATIACEHYDKDMYYINMDTNEIKCEDCYVDFEHKDKLVRIYNVKCLICFDEHPDKIRTFGCGHTICLNCYKRISSCPLCDRNNTEDNEPDDVLINIEGT